MKGLPKSSGTSAQAMVSHYSSLLHARGYVANHDGNVSLRLPDELRFMATPTALSKREVSPADVITVDLAGKVLSGRRRLFSEWHLHAACYGARADVRAVLHAHPPHATALGLAGRSFGTPALPEMVVSLGAAVPLIPFALPRSASQDEAIAHALTEQDADALLLAGNGVLCVGADLEQAYLRLELLEHYAGIYLAAQSLGGVVPLAPAHIDTLLEARTRAGLGAKGRAASKRT